MMRTPPRLTMPTLEERFGLNLWRGRRRAGLSQEGLSDLVGLSRDAVHQLELGGQRRRRTVIVWAAISCSPRALGWTITGFVPWRTGSTQRTPIGWQASWPLETVLRLT